jgi:hypothetical protein
MMFLEMMERTCRQGSGASATPKQQYTRAGREQSAIAQRCGERAHQRNML